MRRKIHAYALDEAPTPRQLRQHPVYRTPGLSFRPLPFADTSHASRRVPEPGELHLWRFQSQWNVTSRQNIPLIVSDSEQSRARRGYSPALSRRYLAGRALLRSILSTILVCPPERLQLEDSPDGQPELVHPVSPRKLTIQVAYAGIWILIGMSASEFRISAAAPSPQTSFGQRDAGGPAAASTNDVAEVQDLTHRTSAATLCGSPPATQLPKLVAQNGAALIAEDANGNYLHVIDLPMPGRLSAAVATREPVSRILAYGWGRP